MPSTPSRLATLFSLSRLPFYVTILGIAWVAYIGWQISDLYADEPLPPERISAKQLRVNESSLRKLNEAITSYTKPTPPTTIPTVKFTTQK